jgi:hypothetical protein
MSRRLKFVINGDDIHVDTTNEMLLRDAVERALKLSNNTSRPLAEWELRREPGTLIPILDQTVGAAEVSDAEWLYLTLFVGAGGAKVLRWPRCLCCVGCSWSCPEAPCGDPGDENDGEMESVARHMQVFR